LRLEIAAGALDDAVHRATMILQSDPGDALANYIMGVSLMLRDEDELAEAALRRSLERARSPEAANDLAWLLVRREKTAEAEALAREAVALRPGMYQAWDTLGKVLIARDDLEGAEQALEKALAMSEHSMSPFLHMAEVQLLKGDPRYARELLGIVEEKQGRLSSEQKVLFDRLVRQAQ
jgi:Flp pilus assembly protein TadD